VDWTDYRLYHLMLNNCMGFEAMVEATIVAAGLSGQEMPAKQGQ